VTQRPLSERPAARPITPSPTATAAPPQKASKRSNGIVWGIGLLIGLGLPLSFFIVSGVVGAQEEAAPAAQTAPIAQVVVTPCTSSMAAAAIAAAENAGFENDAEMIATLSACDDVSGWVDAIKAFPGAGSLTSYTTEDAHYFMGLVCVRDPHTPVCEDASVLGLLDFKLDDPRLAELNG